jgi:hypothetical protein
MPFILPVKKQSRDDLEHLSSWFFKGLHFEPFLPLLYRKNLMLRSSSIIVLEDLLRQGKEDGCQAI